MKKSALIALIVLTMAQLAPAFANDLEKTLKNQYEKHVLGLRNPIDQTHQEFDVTGKPLYQVSQDRWVVYGGIYIQKISLGRDKLRVEGPWVCPDSRKIIHLGKDIKVELHLDHPVTSADEARTILDRVFFLDDNNSGHVLPDFRRSDFVVKGETPYLVGRRDKDDNVTAPVPTHTPEPEFSEQARKQGLQGVVILELVVDKNGTISRVRIIRGLGLGLELQAAEAVKTWLFQPATRNGEAVAVQMRIEVSFNLYPNPRR